MQDEETGVKEDVQAAAEELTGENGQVAAAQDSGVKDTQAAAEEKTVPLSALEAERQKRQQAEAQAMSFQQQFALMQQRPQVQEMPKQARTYFEAKGFDSGDIPTWGQLQEFVDSIGQQQAAQARIQGQIAENQQFVESLPDYGNKVGVMNWASGQFQPSQALQDAMAARPALLKRYASGRMTPQEAYDAVELHIAKKELAERKARAKEQETKKQVALKTGPLSASAAGGGGSVKTESLNAGLDFHKPEDRDRILTNFDSILSGDYDKEI